MISQISLAKVVKKLLIFSIFVHQFLDKLCFFISFTLQNIILPKKVVSLSADMVNLKQLI